MLKYFFFKEMKPYLVKGFYPLRSQTKKKFYLNFYFHISLWWLIISIQVPEIHETGGKGYLNFVKKVKFDLKSRKGWISGRSLN